MEAPLKQFIAAVANELPAYAAMTPLHVVERRGCVLETLLVDDARRIVVERITFPANFTLPSHRHPNVSVADFGVSGSGRFHAGRHWFVNDQDAPKARPLYVSRGVSHGGVTGPRGAKIISVQHWHYWPPAGTISEDWEND